MKILEKIGKFVKEHKKEVIVGASAVGVTVLACYGYSKAKEKIIDSKARKITKHIKAKQEALVEKERKLRESTNNYKTATKEQVSAIRFEYHDLAKETKKILVESSSTDKEIRKKALREYKRSCLKSNHLFRLENEIRDGKPRSLINL